MLTRIKNRFAGLRHGIVRRLRARDPEDYSTAILYAGGTLLTLAIVGFALATLRLSLDDYATRLAEQFDVRVDTVDTQFARAGAFYTRMTDFYSQLQREEALEHAERRPDLVAGLSAPDCPMSISLATGADAFANVPCSLATSRILLNWLHKCRDCQQSGLMIFDLSGRYLAEMGAQKRPVRYRADAYIASQTQATRALVMAMGNQDSNANKGAWLMPRLDPSTGKYVVDYVTTFRQPDGSRAAFVRSIFVAAYTESRIPETMLHSIVMAYPGGMIDFSPNPARSPARQAALGALASSTTRPLQARWRGLTLYLIRHRPGSHWAWIQVVEPARIMSDMWRPGLFALAPFLALTASIWMMIVWFDRRVLTPIKSRSKKGRQSAAFEQSMVESLPLGFAVIQRATRTFLIRNAVARELLDAPRSDSFLSPLLDRANTHDFSATPRLAVDIELARQGETRHYEFAMRSTVYGNADILLLAIYDMTARRETERLLQEAKSAAEAANRAKSDFLAIMSHEIRTPLHGALSNLELFALTSTAPEQRERVDIVRRGFMSLLTLLDNALDFSKIDAQLFQPRPGLFSMRTLIEQVILSALPLIGTRDIRITCSVADDGAQALADEHLLRQVVLNLLHNALKFTQRGKIDVSCRRETGRDGRDRVAIDIADTGQGIPPEDLERIFMPYVQSATPSDAKLRGTGLGLALCKKICELLGGEIRVRSTPGNGTTFSLHIPLAWKNMPKTPYAWPEPRGRTAILLIGQAEPSNDLANVLATAGWQVTIRPADAAVDDDPATAIHVRFERSITSGTRHPGADLVIADDGPLQPGIEGKPNVLSPYSLDGIRSAWRAITGDIESPTPARAPSSLSAREDFSALNVLVVDDDEVCRHLLRNQLAVLGIERVDLAADGDEGLARVGSTRYDLILTDLNMPQSDGRLFIASLAEWKLATPVILTTADVTWERDEDPSRMRIADILTKPWTLSALRDVVSRHVPANASPDGHESFVDAEIAAALASSLPADWAIARTALQARNRAEFGHALHKMTGALLLVGEDAFGQALRALELRSGDADIDSLLREFFALQPIVDAMIEHYSTWESAPE
ncbi:hybrid sensor histidine kinase/response regulator [Burkholderia cepacia]|uniref:hybrid sensor histidine kinase/response regulator n=1 Tax=Burkholderia cepacia TaxID=292 RepID=UPI002ABE3D32|nr:ATP-binding protein [Burkholderia cepacia]